MRHVSSQPGCDRSRATRLETAGVRGLARELRRRHEVRRRQLLAGKDVCGGSSPTQVCRICDSTDLDLLRRDSCRCVHRPAHDEAAGCPMRDELLRDEHRRRGALSFDAYPAAI